MRHVATRLTDEGLVIELFDLPEQNFAPTLQFLLAVLAFDEGFTPDMAFSFGLIWIALAVFSLDMLRAGRRRRASAPAAH